jgi:hypothetical protein
LKPQLEPASHPAGPGALAHVAAAAWFCALAVICSYPLILGVSSWIPGRGAGDNAAFLWNFWWFRYATGHASLSPFHTEHLFAPFGTSLVLNTHSALQSALGATVLRPLPLTTAHNIVLLAGLAANGLAAYALAFAEARRALPAVLAGTIFASSTYIAIHLLGHFNLVHAWVIPVAALAWIRCIDRPTLTRVCAVSVAFAATTYSDYYYLVYSLMFAIGWWLLARGPFEVRVSGRSRTVERVIAAIAVIPLVAILAIVVTGGSIVPIGSLTVSLSTIRNPVAALWLLLLTWFASRLRITTKNAAPSARAKPLRDLAVGLVVYVALILPLALDAVQLVVSGGYVSPPQYWRSGARGIDLATLVLGNPMHPLYGTIVRDAYARLDINMMEQAAWIGIVPIAILLTALRSGTMFGESPRRWMWLTIAFFVWSLGSFLVFAGIDTGIPLPQLIGRVTPILSNARMPGRAIVMVQLGVAILCAIQASKRDWRPLVIVTAIGFALLDATAVPFPMFETTLPRAIDERIASSPRGNVLELPFGIRDGFGETGHFDHRALVHQMVHERPIAGGAISRLSPGVKDGYERVPAFDALLKSRSAELPMSFAADLRNAGITYVVVNTDEVDGSVGLALQERGFRLLAADGTRMLYGID